MNESPNVDEGPSVPPERVSIGDVRASFNRKVKNHFTVTWFGRPLANLITPLFYNAGWSANRVSVMRILLAGAGIGALFAPSPGGPAAAALAFYLCFILDCVDGNIARLRNAVTYWGKYLDGLADFVFVLGAPPAAGIVIWLNGGSALWMLAGALIAIASLTSQMVRSRLSFMREWMVAQSGPLDAAIEDRLLGPRRLQHRASVVYVNGTFFAPLLLFVPDGGRVWYLLALLPLQLASELAWLSGTLLEARIMLDRPRRSIHAAADGSLGR